MPPFDAAMARRHKKGLSPKQVRQWTAVASSMYAKCKKDGGSDGMCEARAIRAANGVTGKPARPTTNEFLTVHSRLTTIPRAMTHHGQDYLVADCTMAICGVLNGGLLSPAVLVPSDWNHVPVVLNHPKDADQVACSARQPEVLASCGLGHVFHTRLGTAKRGQLPVASLIAELWLNRSTAVHCGPDALATIAQLEHGRPMECSTAFYAEAYQEAGEFAGQPYHEVYTRIRPDHLALLPNDIGACSLSDGCGVFRMNLDTLTYETPAPVPCACPDPSGCHCHDSPSAEELPMADPSPTRLARMWQVLRELVTHADEPDEAPAPPDDAALRERLLRQLLDEQGTEALPVTLHALDPETMTVVYEIAGTCYQRYYAEEDGVLSFAGPPDTIDLTEPVSVEPAADDETTAGTTIDDEEETPVMAHDAKTTPSLMVKTRVNRLIANGEKTGWTELDRGRLEAMDEATLIRLEHLPQAPPAPTPREGYRTLADALEDVEPDERDGLEDALNTYKRRKGHLIDVILANKQNPFAKEELQAMKAERLEKLVVMAGEELPDTQTKPLVAQQYAGRRMPQLRVVQTEESEVPPMPDTMALIVNRQKELGLR